MEIHRLQSSEPDRLRAIRLRALAEDPDAFGSTLSDGRARTREDWVAALDQLATFVAVLDGADVGMVRGVGDAERTGSANLYSMWVASEARGRGVGRALVEALVAWARGEGFERLYLEVADDNVGAVTFYARLGFEPTGATGTLPPPRTHITEHERVLVLATPPRAPR